MPPVLASGTTLDTIRRYAFDHHSQNKPEGHFMRLDCFVSFGQIPSLLQVIGSVIIVVGVSLVTWQKRPL